MDKGEISGPQAFDTLFTRNVPHILQKIFLSLDLDSFMSCLKVSKTWNQVLTSDTIKRRAKNLFESCLFDAIKDGRRDVVLLLLQMGTDPDKVGIDGRTALHHAALSGFKDVVELLLDEGADLHNRDSVTDTTPICLAAYWGYTDVVKLFLDRGVDPYRTKKDKFGMTLFQYASIGGHKEVMELLKPHSEKD